MCASTDQPLAFAIKTDAAFAQLPLLLVRVKLIVSDECPKPSKLLMVWLKLPKVETLPPPALDQGPGVNPVPLFDPLIELSVHDVAFTLTPTLLPSPSR